MPFTLNMILKRVIFIIAEGEFPHQAPVYGTVRAGKGQFSSLRTPQLGSSFLPRELQLESFGGKNGAYHIGILEAVNVTLYNWTLFYRVFQTFIICFICCSSVFIALNGCKCSERLYLFSDVEAFIFAQYFP